VARTQPTTLLAHGFTSSRRQPEVAIPSRPSSPTPQPATPGESLFGRLAVFSPAVQRIIQASLRPSTVTAYASYSVRFLQWAINTQISSQTFCEQHVSDFLSQFCSARFSFGYVRSMYCALRCFFRHNFPLVEFTPSFWEDFLKGARNMCKRHLRKEFVWNPQIYVDFVCQRALPRSMASASKETVTILALSTGLRCSDLQNLGRAVKCSPDSIFIPFLARGKTRPKGIDREGVTIAKYHGPERLCVMAIVKRYLQLSALTYKKKGWNLPTQLFASSTTPNPAKTATIRGWLKRELGDAGIRDPDGLVVPAHSIRSAATSAAYWFGLDFDQIKNLAGWANESCFQQFYKRKLCPAPANLMVMPSEDLDPEGDMDQAMDNETEIKRDRSFCFVCFEFACRTPLTCAEKVPTPEQLVFLDHDC
jgi:hypothetical protein